MNLCLLDPFQSDFPEVIEEYLEHGITKCVAFNRRGTLLAAGCSDGSCIIWDFDTRGVAKELHDPKCSASVTSVSWSKCGRRLLAAFTDKTLVLWDVYLGEKVFSQSLQQTVLHCRLDPGKALPTSCLACPLSGAPVLVDFERQAIYSIPVVAPSLHVEDGPSNGRGKHGDTNPGVTQSIATYNKRGDLVYVGNSKGEILIVDSKTQKVYTVIHVPGGAAIRHVVFSRSGQYLLTNSNDRIIRCFENNMPREGTAATLAEASNGTSSEILVSRKSSPNPWLKLTKEFQDAVNRMHWKAVCFNGDGECVVGASAIKGEHKIHVWNRNFGQLARILEGPKEGLCDLAWHPTRPIVASVSMSGIVYLWAKDYTENWSAFAPDFKELEENEEYIEREDEFDINVEEAEKVKPASAEDDVEVDVETVEKVAAFSDSDDSHDGLYFLPTVPLPDDPPDSPSNEPSPTQPKPSSSSATETDAGSPNSERGRDHGHMELVTCLTVGSPQEDEIGANGRIKRKRKLSEKAAELQAEKGRRSAQTKVRVTTPKRKPEKHPEMITPNQTDDIPEKEELQAEGEVASRHHGSRIDSASEFKMLKVKTSKTKVVVRHNLDSVSSGQDVALKCRENSAEFEAGAPRGKKILKPKKSKPVSAITKPSLITDISEDRIV